MNGPEVLRVVDAIHRDKNIDKEIVFEGIEQAILSAARKHFGEDYELEVDIDRQTGEPGINCNGEPLDAEVIGDILGRVAAQTAKQVMIQKIREAERDSLYDEFDEIKGTVISGTIVRFEGGSAIVNVGKVEALLPRSEQIPGESHRVNERVRAVVLEVRKSGSRVKVILSRCHVELVMRLFETEIPEVSERIIEIRSIAREAGYRSKVAVSCIDNKIDPVGACVGVRGSRIRTIVDELGGERIDIVRWNESLDVLVPNAMQPAEVEDVVLCPMLGRVLVLVRDDQLSLAIGKRGQNVRLASKLVGWDIEVMTQQELDEQLEGSVMAFSVIPEVSVELAEEAVPLLTNRIPYATPSPRTSSSRPAPSRRPPSSRAAASSTKPPPNAILTSSRRWWCRSARTRRRGCSRSSLTSGRRRWARRVRAGCSCGAAPRATPGPP